MADWIGYLAAFCTTFAFVPQALHTWRSKDTSGISLGMYSIFVLGIALWLCYGLLIGNYPMIIANAVTLVLAGSVLLLKIRHG
ncbi:MAG: SemiSWEET family sugar transporter [Gammaproteobacteria bacterium]|nr:SemiSWEET family sugar transporter [Gammaproteobacteria bacterium]